jgi:hypothetical protein
MLETTSTTRSPFFIERWLIVSAAAPRSSRRERYGIDTRQSGGAAPRQCQRLECHIGYEGGLMGVLAARVGNTGKIDSVSSRSPDTTPSCPSHCGTRARFRLSNRLIDRPTRLNQLGAAVTGCAGNERATSVAAIGTQRVSALSRYPRRVCGAGCGLRMMRQPGG